MQKPTPVGRSGYVGTAASASAARTISGSRCAAHALSSQKRGNEQISALFENGVIVPIRRIGFGAAHERDEPAARDDRIGIEQHDVGA